MRLYHYTTETGKDGILKKKVIDQSTDTIKDCLLGKGVYLTSLDPYSHSKEDIAWNNYGPALGPAKAGDGYVDWAIEVDIPRHEVMENGDHRDIYCYPEMGLWLENYPYKVINVSQPEMEEESSSLNTLTQAVAGGVAVAGAGLLLGYGLSQLFGKKEDTKDSRKPAQPYFQ